VARLGTIGGLDPNLRRLRRPNVSPERIAEVIFRLENDGLGKATYAGSRIATVKVGAPFCLPGKVSRVEIAEWTRKLENASADLM
jgi:hypothetical protein